MPHSARDQRGTPLHRQGFCRLPTGRSSPFADSRNLVFEVSVVLAQGSEPPDSRACRQILVNHVPVDIGHYCDAVERLCGSIILSYRFMMERGVLHGVTLPRSWFINLFRPLPLLDKNTTWIPHFVNDTLEFLRRVDLQREHYKPRSVDPEQFKHNGSRLTPLYASAYIARM